MNKRYIVRLSLGRVLPGPGHVEHRLGAGPLNRLIEQPHVLGHAFGVLHGHGALLLQHDVVVATGLDGPGRLGRRSSESAAKLHPR